MKNFLLISQTLTTLLGLLCLFVFSGGNRTHDPQGMMGAGGVIAFSIVLVLVHALLINGSIYFALSNQGLSTANSLIYLFSINWLLICLIYLAQKFSTATPSWMIVLVMGISILVFFALGFLSLLVTPLPIPNRNYLLVGGGILQAFILFLSFNPTALLTLGGKFNWRLDTSTPTHFPVTVLRLNLINGETTVWMDDSMKIIEESWGYSTTQGSSLAFNSLPERIDVIWYSYVEKKYYQGAFELPLIKIKQLFEKGIGNGSEGSLLIPQTFRIGLAPNGGVAVWLVDDEQLIIKQVAFFHATKFDDPDTKLKDRFAEDLSYIERVIKKPEGYSSDAKKWATSIPQGLWEKYQTNYFWSLDIFPVDLAVTDLSIDYFNGDREQIDAKLLASANPAISRPVPTSIGFKWMTQKGEQFYSVIQLSEEEIFQAFDSAIEHNSKVSVTLKFQMGPEYQMKASMVGKTQIFDLKNFNFSHYQQ